MKTKSLLTVTCIFLFFSLQVFSTKPEKNANMKLKVQTADGDVLTVKVQSESIANNTLGDSGERRVSVYLPPGYDENGSTNYPVVYMLPGEIGTNEDWFSTMGGQSFVETLNKAIISKKIKPMILVFPDTKNKITGSWYTNSAVCGNWEDFIVNELVYYIDEHFRTLPFAVSRGIAGRNVGGYGALKLATKHSDVFGAVYSINAFVDFKTVITDENIWVGSFKIASGAKSFPTGDAFANKLLGMALSFTPDENNPWKPGILPKTVTGEILNSVYEKWIEEDPLYLIKEYGDKLKTLKALTVDCSTSDVLIMLNSNYSEQLAKNGIDHKFTFFNGSDNSALAMRVYNFMLPMFSENLCHSLLEIDLKPTYMLNEVIDARMVSDGNIFIMNEHMSNEEVLLKSHTTIKIKAYENSMNEIKLNRLDKGIYSIYAVSNSGFQGETYMFGVNDGTPQVKIHVTDSYTGEELSDCTVRVKDENYLTDEHGEIVFENDGYVDLSFSKENYATLEEGLTIYTDTSFQFSLVKDSRIQVIERGYGMPVFEATVTQGNQATITGKDGFTTIHNVKDEMLDVRIFKPGYFTEVVHSPIKPGGTKVVELTKKKANVFFYVMGNEGPTSKTYVNLGDFNYYSQENGKVSFIEMDTRNEYTYSVNDFNYEEVHGSFFLENDTVINIFLQPKKETKKKANVFFYITGNEGPTSKIYVNLGDFSYYSQENGKVSFIEMDTRNEYTYSVNDFNYEEVHGSFFLENDTVINIFLQPKENKSGFIAKNGQLTTDAEELSMAEILVYPNPAKDVITIETDGKERYAIELLTQSGSVVYQSKTEGTLHRINLSNLSNGVYFVTVKADNFYHTQRIMKL